MLRFGRYCSLLLVAVCSRGSLGVSLKNNPKLGLLSGLQIMGEWPKPLNP